MLWRQGLWSYMRSWLVMSQRSRAVVVRGDTVIKLYEIPEEALKEYSALLSIYEAGPKHFRVPKPLAIKEVRGRTAIIMEKVGGTPLSRYVMRAARGDREAIRLLFFVGRALRELHSIKADLPRCRAAASRTEMAHEVVSSLEWVCSDGVRALLCGLLSRYLPKPEHFLEVSNEVFVDSLIHGEFYPSHIFIDADSSTPVFIDFGFSCIGPAYIDLAMFVVSVATGAPALLNAGLEGARIPFLLGYFGSLPSRLDLSLKLAEAYMAVRVLRDSLLKAGGGIDRALQALLALYFLRVASRRGELRW